MVTLPIALIVAGLTWAASGNMSAKARQRFARCDRRFLELRGHGFERRVEADQLSQDTL